MIHHHVKQLKRATVLIAMAIAAGFGAASAESSGTGCATPQTAMDIRRCDASVTAAASRKNELFLSRGSSVLVLRAGDAFDRAHVLVPSLPDRAVEAIYPALDAIYVVVREGDVGRMLRVPVRLDGVKEVGFTQKYVCHSRNCRSFPAQKAIRVISVPLPVAGPISEALANPETRGIRLRFVARGVVTYCYQPSEGRFVEVDVRGLP
jgi:hypothetical protein